MKVIIIGGGIVGLSTAWALARSGHEALLYEQGPLPHAGSASYDQHRLIRLPYADHIGYCAMVVDALKAWQRMWDDLGQSHYVETGSLALSSEEGDWADLSEQTLSHLGLDYATLDRKQIEALCPFLKVPEGVTGLHNETGGLLFASRIVDSLIGDLHRRGVDLHEKTRIVGVDPAAGAVMLQDGRRESADAIVVAAGAWTTKLFPELARRAVPHRQVVAYMEAPEAHAASWARAPVMVHLLNDVDIYAAPPAGGSELKFGCGQHRRPGDPDALEPLAEGEAAEVAAAFAPLLRDFADYKVLRGQVCPYAIAPDERFVAEQNGPVLLVGGCSGHMFKFGAVMGEQLARTAVGDLAFKDFRLWAEGRHQTLTPE